MTLYEKIKSIYPSLVDADFDPSFGTVKLQNDGDGDYIKEWKNSNKQPTQEQLDAIN
jgi:hypothetical protein